jgi:hypothetical protein
MTWVSDPAWNFMTELVKLAIVAVSIWGAPKRRQGARRQPKPPE